MVGPNEERSLSTVEELSFRANHSSYPNNLAQRVIVVANNVMAVAYSHDRCCQCHLKEIWRPDWK